MKGQVTIWIILGIIILVVVAGATYLGLQRSSFFQGQVEEIPPQIIPIKQAVDSCFSEITREAASILGFQGGYITLPEDELVNPLINGFSTALYPSFNSQSGISYWFYETSNNVQVNTIPNIIDMEKQLEDYISRNAYKCLDFSGFVNQGYDININELADVSVNIQENIVKAIVDYPIEIQINELLFTLERHNGDVELPLGRLYELSRDILDTENSNFFLEKKTLDVLGAYEEIPFSSTTFDCEIPFWSEETVKQNFKEIMSQNIAKIRVFGTSYNNDIPEYFQEQSLSRAAGDVHVKFSYSSNWPTEIEISPSDSGILQGDNILKEVNEGLEGFVSSLFCITNYHFIYNIKYPVLITLNQEDYIFQFATQVIIKNNQERENLLGTDLFPDLENEICNEEIHTWDITALTPNPISAVQDAEVNLKCSSTSCSLGRTDLNGEFTGQVPACVNGAITVEKPGYKIGKSIVSTNEPGSTDIFLEPVIELPVTIKVFDENQGLREPYDSERIIFTFKQEDFTSTIVYPDNQEIKLVPGIYEVDSYIIGKSSHPIQLQEQQIRKCVDVPEQNFFGILFGGTEEECFESTIPGTELEQVIKGGAEFVWEVKRDDLYDSDELIVYTISKGFPSSLEELSSIYKERQVEEFSAGFRYPELR